MKKLLYIFILLAICSNAMSQKTMQGHPDSLPRLKASQETYIGFKFILTDNSVVPSNPNLHFSYTSLSNGYVMSHDMSFKGVGSIPGIGFGINETIKNHLFINLATGTVGYAAHVWNITAGTGAGYSLPVNKKKNLAVRASLNIYYENITYGLGSYYDSTLIGFEIAGNNIGTSVKNIKYVNNLLCFNPALELVYRGKNFDFFLNAGYSHALLYKEKLDFYTTHIPVSDGLYDPAGKPVSKGAILPGNYIIQAGVIYEFEL